MQTYHLAQINIALGHAPIDDPFMVEFVAALDRINALAESSEGFVWRLQTDEGNATSVQLFEDSRIIVNMSVWKSLEALKSYVYSGDHLNILKQKKQWFEKPTKAHLALWWVPAGTIPTLEHARQALDSINVSGSTSRAFTFANPYPAPSAPVFAGNIV